MQQAITTAINQHGNGSTALPPILPMPLRAKLDPKTVVPGDPYTRSTMAAMDYTDRDVAKVFKDNPSSLWVVTPYEIIERGPFLSKAKQLPPKMPA